LRRYTWGAAAVAAWERRLEREAALDGALFIAALAPPPGLPGEAR
jgi:hypothetical protein